MESLIDINALEVEIKRNSSYDLNTIHLDYSGCTIEKGDTVLVVAKNGSGKTVLMNILSLNAFIGKSSFDVLKGDVVLNFPPLDHLNLFKLNNLQRDCLRRLVSYLENNEQKDYTANSNLSLYQLLFMPVMLGIEQLYEYDTTTKNISKKKAKLKRKRLKEESLDMGKTYFQQYLQDFLNVSDFKRIKKIIISSDQKDKKSTGQIQMVRLISYMIKAELLGTILLLDEPFQNLDEDNIQKGLDMISELQRKRPDLAVLMTTQKNVESESSIFNKLLIIETHQKNGYKQSIAKIKGARI